jgi:hypothetical protein
MYLFEQEMTSQLSESEQMEVDQLNNDIRRLTEECKKLFSERLQLQYDRVLEQKNMFSKRHELLSEVGFHRINSSDPPCMILHVPYGRKPSVKD